MKLLSRFLSLLVLFSIATVLAEAGLLAVLWKRGSLSAQTMHNLLTVAYDVPVREIFDQLVAKAQPVKKEMVSFSEVQEARMLTSLDLDLQQMSSDKGFLDLEELRTSLEKENGRYTVIRDGFKLQWANLQKGVTESATKDLQYQIESLQPKAAKDQLLRILDSPNLAPDTAMNQVVAIFKGMALDKRKKIVAEFKDNDSQRLQDILRQIRLGMPEVDVLRDTRTKLQEFRGQE